MLLYQWALIDNLSPLNGRHSTPSGLSVRGTVYSMQMHLNSRAIAAHYQYKRQPSLLGDNTVQGPALVGMTGEALDVHIVVLPSLSLIK